MSVISFSSVLFHTKIVFVLHFMYIFFSWSSLELLFFGLTQNFFTCKKFGNNSKCSSVATRKMFKNLFHYLGRHLFFTK